MTPNFPKRPAILAFLLGILLAWWPHTSPAAGAATGSSSRAADARPVRKVNRGPIALLRFVQDDDLPLPGDETDGAAADQSDVPEPRLPPPAPPAPPPPGGDGMMEEEPDEDQVRQPDLIAPGTSPPPSPSTLPTLPPTAGGFPEFTSAATPPSSVAATESRLASVPDMFGDSFFGSPTLRVIPNSHYRHGIAEAAVDLPVAGGANRVKIGENNNPLPQCRFYFDYNHFENAFHSDVLGITETGAPIRSMSDSSLDRFTIGWERAFHCGQWSVELRMPFVGGYDFDFAPDLASAAGEASVHGGDVGNLGVILKRLIYSDDHSAAAWGVAFETPTGSASQSRIESIEYTLDNEALHVSPYLGVLNRPDDCLFLMAFAQLDIPTGGNTLRFREAFRGGRGGELGKLSDQTLLYLDVSAGYWVYRNPCARFLKGFAPVVELHYTTALQESDFISGYVPTSDHFDLHFRDNDDALNLTLNLNFQIGCNTRLRVGGIFPLGEDERRFFDSEVAIQLNQYY